MEMRGALIVVGSSRDVGKMNAEEPWMEQKPVKEWEGRVD